MLFVRDRGEEVVQTSVNMKKPYELLHDCNRMMFASYLFMPKPERVLIVGLGGGAMVHFLKHYDPKVQVDAVEIDPMVVKVADRYFDIRAEKNVNIITADGLKYLTDTENLYDVIYMDAFLKPSEKTDSTGAAVGHEDGGFLQEPAEEVDAQGAGGLQPQPASGGRDREAPTAEGIRPDLYLSRRAKRTSSFQFQAMLRHLTR